jgi:hypothetical protein
MAEQLVTPQVQIASGMGELLDIVRGDVRDSETRLTAAMAALEHRLTDRIDRGSLDHAKLHEEEGAERRRVHDRIEKFIRDQELSDARKDGILGAARFVVELVSRNAGRLGYLAGAVGLLLGFLTGNLHVDFGQMP